MNAFLLILDNQGDLVLSRLRQYYLGLGSALLSPIGCGAFDKRVKEDDARRERESQRFNEALNKDRKGQ